VRGAAARALSRHRRPVAAALAAASVGCGLASVGAGRSATTATTAAVVVAAHDLAPGELLTAPDLVVARYPVELAPAGALGLPAAAIGRLAAGPVRRGEPVTDVRLSGPGLLAGTTGLVAAPIRLADAQSAALVRPGDRIDVIAAAGQDAPVDDTGAAGYPSDPTGAAATSETTAHAVAVGVRVLLVPAPGQAQDNAGALLVLAVSPGTARDLAAASARGPLSLVIERP
jgi:Flp pilus assembly protein CpaB